MADKVFAGARGGKLALKGVALGPSGGVKKKKRAVESEAAEPVPEVRAAQLQLTGLAHTVQVAGIGGDVGAAKPNKTYEELFPSEVRQASARSRLKNDSDGALAGEAHGGVQGADHCLGQQRARRACRPARLLERSGAGGASHRGGAPGPAQRAEGGQVLSVRRSGFAGLVCRTGGEVTQLCRAMLENLVACRTMV